LLENFFFGGVKLTLLDILRELAVFIDETKLSGKSAVYLAFSGRGTRSSWT
jgi:hypothetical protein